MRQIPEGWLACPLDGLALRETGAGLGCAQGHRYDRAREGYVNVLGNRHKASSDPGDSKDMVRARSGVLDSGLFEPLAQTLVRRIDTLAPSGPCRIADAGCGDGYYLDYIRRHVADRDVACAGFDISKPAIQAAAKRSRDCLWLVANNRWPPFVTGSTGIITCLFGFPVFDAFRAVQPAGGHVVMVDPGPDHLLELRAIIYPKVRRSPPPDLSDATLAGYAPQDTETLTYRKSLKTADAIRNLLMMTPHYFRMPREGWEKLATLTAIEVTIDLAVRVLRAG